MAIVVRNRLKPLLVDNRSYINNIFEATFNKIQVNHPAIPTIDLFVGFTSNIVNLMKKLTLVVDMKNEPQVACHYIEFLVVDNSSVYHRVLGRPTIKNVLVIITIH